MFLFFCECCIFRKIRCYLKLIFPQIFLKNVSIFCLLQRIKIFIYQLFSFFLSLERDVLEIVFVNFADDFQSDVWFFKKYEWLRWYRESIVRDNWKQFRKQKFETFFNHEKRNRKRQNVFCLRRFHNLDSVRY